MVILDGWGEGKQTSGNPFTAAKLPTIEHFANTYPKTLLQASGVAVGLPWGEAGNSEIGHMTIGAGRVIFHYLPRIIFAIRDGSFFKNPAFLQVTGHVKTHQSRLHLLGLLSSGTVHSYIDHLTALLELAKREGLSEVLLHLFTDGRDSPPKEAATFLENLLERLAALGTGKLASLAGRFYAMDRDRHWNRIKDAYECFVFAKGERTADPVGMLREWYRQGETDEFVKPTVLLDAAGNPLPRIGSGDGLIFFNFREDSMRELVEAFTIPAFLPIRPDPIPNLAIATMTRYEPNIPVAVGFEREEVSNPLGEVVARAGKRQLRIAESEKYAHVTYFFNGGKEAALAGEEREIIPSGSTPHFDEHPEMGAGDLAERVSKHIEKDEFDFYVLNFANADMVGHTGNFSATARALEAIDAALGKLEKTVLSKDGVMLITADHGNAEEKMDPISGEARTEHTMNPVPLWLIGREFQNKKFPPESEPSGVLSDVAPTLLSLMDLAIPAEMTGKSFLPLLISRS